MKVCGLYILEEIDVDGLKKEKKCERLQWDFPIYSLYQPGCTNGSLNSLLKEAETIMLEFKIWIWMKRLDQEQRQTQIGVPNNPQRAADQWLDTCSRKKLTKLLIKIICNDFVLV